MKKQWTKIIIYLLFVGFLTFFASSFVEASKIVDFLKDQESELLNDNTKLISATAVANNHDSTEAYVLKEPLYHENFISYNALNQIKYNIEIYIYGFVEFKGETAHNSIAILLKNLSIADDNAYLDSNNYHEIQAVINLNQPITINETISNSYTETFVTVFDDEFKMIMFNYDLLQTEGEYVQIQDIRVSYSLISGGTTTLIQLTNSDLLPISYNDAFDDTYQRDIKNISLNADLLETYGLNNYQNNSDIYYNESLLNLLDSYNKYYIKYIAIELAIILPITYFLFFHKQVMWRIKNKRKNQKEAQKQKYDDFKKEMLDNNK